jgi:hypothetical protein
MTRFKTSEIADSPTKKAALIVIACTLLNATLIYFIVLPLKDRVKDTQAKVNDLIANNENIQEIIASIDDKRSLVENLEMEHQKLVDSGVLTPLLNSHTMRAKTIIEPLALQYGLIINDVAELPLIPMRRPAELETVTYSRLPIEFTTSGSYTQITAFVNSTEQELPMVALSSLKIIPQNRDPENHLVKISLEWPVEQKVPQTKK